MDKSRSSPNIIITGTPGVGKSSIAKDVAEKAEMNWIDVSKLAVENDLVQEYDKHYSCPVIDDETVRKVLKKRIRKGNCILDFYSSEIFLQKWVDAVFVIRADNKILYDRLAARGYNGIKLQHNMEFEILGIALEEAQDNYDSEIVHVIENNDNNQLNDTVHRIVSWVEMWKANNSTN